MIVTILALLLVVQADGMADFMNDGSEAESIEVTPYFLNPLARPDVRAAPQVGIDEVDTRLNIVNGYRLEF